MTNFTLDDLIALREGFDIEFKEAMGKSGHGEIPKSFWETYSAFANTEGGEIYLGIKETNNNSIKVLGIQNHTQLKKDLFDLAHNREKISCNLLNNHSVESIVIDGKTILKITIPRASRRSRPVYVGLNPLKGTFIRRNEGDYLLDEASIKKMLGEQGEESLDAKLLNWF